MNVFIRMGIPCSFLLLWTGFADAQIVTSLSSGNALAGGSVSLNIDISNSGSVQPSALQWTMNYSSSDIASVSIAPAANTNSDGKSVVCSSGSQSSTTCVVYGMNQTAVSAGPLAVATFQLSSNPPDSPVAVQISSTVASDATGEAITSSGSGGSITVIPPIPQVGLICSPTSINTPGTAACSVSLSSTAPTSGFVLSLASSNGILTVPQTVSIAAGTSTASFTANASAVATSESATITATGGSNAPSTTFSLLPQIAPKVSSLSCSANTISTPGSTKCTLQLSGPAPAAGFKVVLLSTSNLKVPGNSTVPAGTAQATFTVIAGALSQSEPAFLIAVGGGGWGVVQLVLQAPGQ